MSSSRIVYLDTMRAIAIVMVVCIHALGYSHELPPLQLEVIKYIVHSIAVPVFFLVDGFLIARRFLNGTIQYSTFIKKSTFRLLVPWILFSIIYAVSRYWAESYGYLDKHILLGHGVCHTLGMVYSSVIAPQMYFLLSLYLIRIIYPFIKLLFFRLNLAFSLTVYVAIIIAYNSYGIASVFPFDILSSFQGQDPIIHAIYGLQFYILGILLSRFEGTVSNRSILIPSVFTLMLCTYLKFGQGIELHTITKFSYLLSLFTLCAIYKFDCGILDWIGKNTMGIYLLHTPIVMKIASIAVNKITTTPLLSFTLIVLLSIAVSGLLAYALSLSRYGSILLGSSFHKQ